MLVTRFPAPGIRAQESLPIPESQYLFRQQASGPCSRATPPSYNGLGFRMRCPRCHFDHELQTTECLKCGIVFSRYRPPLEAEAKQDSSAVSAPRPVSLPAPPIDRSDTIRELKYRALA